MNLSRSTRLPGDAPRLISIVRRPYELFALISNSVFRTETGASFEVAPIPFDRLKRSIYLAKDRLQESWRYLGKVKAADEATLYHLLVLLLETVPDLASEKRTDPLPAMWGAPPISTRAMQAPRAFKLRPLTPDH